MTMISENKQIKVNILINAWNDISKQIETVSGYENKTSISYVTFIVAFTYYTTKDGHILVFHKIAYSIVILAACLIIAWFLGKNKTRMKWLCQSLIRVQRALSMYEPGIYLPRVEPDGNDPEHPEQKSIVFGYSGQEWGVTTKYLNSIPHLAMVILASIAAVLFIVLKNITKSSVISVFVA